ncbi:MAG TPA: CerR family C-terminal domain-containing protein [Sedimentisphaerales bacterium]|nr:CerR family C-terminal domain-containing protein [Sedimentisphaerales bacterium]
MASYDDNRTNRGLDKHVRDRLLDAAEELFAMKGFDGTSVRELAAAADCNLASVNYYFGGKDNLYLEVWRRQFNLLRQARIASIERVLAKGDGEIELEDLLRSYATAFIEPLTDEGRSNRLIRLMAREIIDPHLPRDMFLTEMIRPVMTAMRAALAKTCPGLPESTIPLQLICIVGQLMHVGRVKAMFDQAGGAEWPRFDLNEAIEHIVKFSAAGIRAFVEGKSQ